MDSWWNSRKKSKKERHRPNLSCPCPPMGPCPNSKFFMFWRARDPHVPPFSSPVRSRQQFQPSRRDERVSYRKLPKEPLFRRTSPTVCTNLDSGFPNENASHSDQMHITHKASRLLLRRKTWFIGIFQATL